MIGRFIDAYPMIPIGDENFVRITYLGSREGIVTYESDV